MSADWLVCAETREALTRLDEVIASGARADEDLLAEAVEHALSRPGKRLRSALVLLAAGDEHPKDDAHLLRAAAALEMMHVASLCHDDVVDRAPERRGVPSVTARFGDRVATAAGTRLFVGAIGLLDAVDADVARLVSAGARELCAGELHELGAGFDLELGLEEHLRILLRKTAVLFELPAHAGAVVGAQPPSAVTALRQYGRRVGTAFQIADDALDLVGDPRTTGKATGTDLRQGVYSYPVLLALQDPVIRGELRDVLLADELSDDDIAGVVVLLNRRGYVARALGVAREYAEEAVRLLDALPEGPSRASLVNLARMSVRRGA